MPSPSTAFVNAACRKDFVSFVVSAFIVGSRRHFSYELAISAIAYHLEQVWLGYIKRLIITVPPRSLKSIMCSVAFPAFTLGHDPTKRFIAASYSGELAIKHANDFRMVVNTPQYRAIFPPMGISAMKNTQTEVVTTCNGFRLATSVDGALTGRGGDIIIIDDPIAALAALSQNSREHSWIGTSNTLPSRLDDQQNGAIVLVMQRLHEDDLGRRPDAWFDEWTLLNLPAIAEQDEQIPIGNGQSHLRRPATCFIPSANPGPFLSRDAPSWERTPLRPSISSSLFRPVVP